MKFLHPLVLALTIAAMPVFASAADKSNASLPIDQALKIAQDYLQSHGTPEQHIIGLTLEAATVGKLYWYAHWSPAIPQGQKRQIGLRIEMDGSSSVFVKGANGEFEAPPGQRQIGARNIR